MERAHAAVTLDKRHHGMFFGRRQECLTASLAADIGLIDFDGLARPALGFGEHAAMIFHGFTDTMREEPRGFQAAAKHPLKLAGADALLAGAHQMNGLKPQAKRQVAVLKDAAHPHRERLAAGVALAQARARGLAGQSPDLVARRLAMRANRTLRPKVGFDVFEGGFLVVEPGGGKNGIGHGIAPRAATLNQGVGYVK